MKERWYNAEEAGRGLNAIHTLLTLDLIDIAIYIVLRSKIEAHTAE